MIEKMENFIYKHTERHYKVKKLQEGYSNLNGVVSSVTQRSRALRRAGTVLSFAYHSSRTFPRHSWMSRSRRCSDDGSRDAPGHDRFSS